MRRVSLRRPCAGRGLQNRVVLRMPKTVPALRVPGWRHLPDPKPGSRSRHGVARRRSWPPPPRPATPPDPVELPPPAPAPGPPGHAGGVGSPVTRGPGTRFCSPSVVRTTKCGGLDRTKLAGRKEKRSTDLSGHVVALRVPTSTSRVAVTTSTPDSGSARRAGSVENSGSDHSTAWNQVTGSTPTTVSIRCTPGAASRRRLSLRSSPFQESRTASMSARTRLPRVDEHCSRSHGGGTLAQ